MRDKKGIEFSKLPSLKEANTKRIPKEMKVLNVDEIIKNVQLKQKFDEAQKKRGDYHKFLE